MPHPLSLEGKTAVIVGGTSGIGRALSLGLADAGADVIPSARRKEQVEESAAAIEAKGATLLFLPPYSPDLNPIEQVFAKLKTLLRRAEPRSRTKLWDTIGSLLDRFSQTECRNYLHNCGYGQTK